MSLASSEGGRLWSFGGRFPEAQGTCGLLCLAEGDHHNIGEVDGLGHVSLDQISRGAIVHHLIEKLPDPTALRTCGKCLGPMGTPANFNKISVLDCMCDRDGLAMASTQSLKTDTFAERCH